MPTASSDWRRCQTHRRPARSPAIAGADRCSRRSRSADRSAHVAGGLRDTLRVGVPVGAEVHSCIWVAETRASLPRGWASPTGLGWATEQVGRHGRAVSEVADDLACDRHTVNDAVIAYGTALVEDPDRIGEPDAVGLDETLYVREGEYRAQRWSTQIVDVGHSRLLDIVAGRDSVEPCAWFAARPETWRAQIRWATLDLSSSYKMVFDTMLPDATQVADPFHVVRLANQAPR